jgi:hypothetical protein
MGAVHLAAGRKTDQSRHDFDPEPVGHSERRVVDPRRHGLGKGRIVLRVDRDPGLPRELAEDRRREGAGRAVALDDCDEAILRQSAHSVPFCCLSQHETRPVGWQGHRKRKALAER